MDEQVCSTCKYWRPEVIHKIWGRCGRVDDKMQFGAISEYPYDKPPKERVRLSDFDDRGRISTYKDFGCNRHEPKVSTPETMKARLAPPEGYGETRLDVTGGDV